MYVYSPPFTIVKKGSGYKLSDQLGGRYSLDKSSLISILYLLGKEPNDSLFHSLTDTFGIDARKRYQQLLNAGFLTIVNHKRRAPFNYERVIERVLNEDTKENSIINVGTVTLASINCCPYSCKGCYVNFQKHGNKEVPSQILEEVIRDSAFMGANNLSLSGGEVTTTPQTASKTASLAAFAKTSGIESRTLITTGYHLTEYLNMFIDSGINSFQISIDGFESYNDKYKHAKDATKRSIESIDACIERKVRFTTNSVITRQNLNETPEFIEFLTSRGVQNIRLSKIITEDRDLALNIEDLIKFDKIVKHLKAKCNTAMINGPFDNPYVVEGYCNCVAGKLYAHVDFSGEVWPCAFMNDRVIGNVNETCLKDMWSIDNPVLGSLSGGKAVSAECAGCKKRFHCFGNCLREYEIKKEQCQNG